MPENTLLTPQEVAAYVRVPIATVWRWCRLGMVPAIKMGRHWRIPEDALRQHIAARTSRPSTD